MNYNFDKAVQRYNTSSMKWDILEQKFGSTDVLPMWVADMDFESPPAVVEALKQRAEHAVYGYTLREGYYDALRSWLKARHGWDTKTEWMSNTHGVVPSLSILVDAFTEPGDGVIIQQPVYHPFTSVVEQNGRKVVSNPLAFDGERYTMELEGLERILSEENAKLLILCNPHNPVGRSWTKDELVALGRLCQSHGVRVISDEIHADLTLPTHAHTPFASLEDFGEQCITCVAPSKTFNLAGLHTSTVIIANDSVRRKFEAAVQRWSAGSGNVFGIVAAEAAYREGADWLDELRDYLLGNVNHLTQYLADNIPQLRVVPPEATYLVWIDCSKLGMSDTELRTFFLTKAKVAPNMGTEFGPGGEGFIRLNIACQRVFVEKALGQLHHAILELHPRSNGGTQYGHR